MRGVLEEHEIPAIVETIGSIWQILHMARSPLNYLDFLESDRTANAALDLELMRNGVSVIPGLRRFVSSAHTDDDLTQTLEALDRACRAVKGAP